MIRNGAASASSVAALYHSAHRASPTLVAIHTLRTSPSWWLLRCRTTRQSPHVLIGSSQSPLLCHRRAASTGASEGSSAAGRGVAHEENVKALAAAEDELRHVRQDVNAITAETRQESSDGAASSASSSAVAPAAATATGSGGGGDGDGAGAEPTLADLDRSIPQVDSEFIASLIRSRNLRREDFLTRKEAVKQRVDALTKKTATSVTDAARLPLVGGMGFGWLANLRSSADDSGGADGGLVATSAEAPVVASAEVLAQLSETEKDLLHTTRPEYDDGFVLIDCRTVNEVTSWGMIEGAKVLPAHELFEAFHATPEEFLHDYGFAKPRPDDIIICYCQFGPRSLMAAQILSWMGYLKVMHFRDGYYEWGKQYNLLLRRWMEHDKESGNELRRLATFRAGLELQREIAPEFNALPMQEARKYLRDTTRSPGTLLVGDGLRAEAYAMVAKLTEGLAPPSLPGVLEGSEAASIASGDAGSGTATSLESRSTQTRRLGENHLAQFLEQATGMNAQAEMQRPATSMSLGEAQATVIDSLASGAELGASPDAGGTPLSPRSRPN